jgi:hypothetical protein
VLGGFVLKLFSGHSLGRSAQDEVPLNRLVLQARASRASDVGSIPIARSINPVDAVEFTFFLHPNFPIKTRVWTQLDADSGRRGILDATILQFFTSPITAFARTWQHEAAVLT